MPDLDDTDRAFVESLMPAGSHLLAIAAVLVWMDPATGEQHWRNWVASDLPVSSIVGLYELGKLDTIARSDTGLPIEYDDLGDA